MGCMNAKDLRQVDPAPPQEKESNLVEVQQIAPSKGSAKVETLEKFLYEGLTAGDSKEALRVILSNPRAKAFFYTFLKSEMAEENMQFFEKIEEIRKSISAGGSNGDTDDAARKLLATYITAGSPREVNLSEAMKLTLMQKNEEMDDAFDAKLMAAQREVMAIMVMGAFPRFLKSPLYKKWRNDEVIYINNVHNKAVDANAPPTEGQLMAQDAFDAMEIQEIEQLSFCSSWLQRLIGSVEALPICVSLSTANNKRPGFPLIYVNAYFEKVTGYPRSEIIGRNCRFLQGANTEAESIGALSLALRSALPVKVEITNYRKDGTQFTNLLAMKPIFDEKGVYRYVVGLQFDVNNEVSSLSKLKFANKMLRMIPDSIIGGSMSDET